MSKPINLLILVALALYFLLLRFFPCAFDRWPLQMHYALHDKHIFSHGLAALLPLLATTVLLLILASRLRRPGHWLAPGLFLAALALQGSLSFLDAGLSARRLSSTLLQPEYGHSEFVVLAFAERSPIALARDYETRCILDPRFVFARTKPPGQLFFYTLAAHAYRSFAPPAFFDDLARRADFYDRGPLTAFGAFATILFSIISCLTVLVLAALGRAAGGRRLGAWIALAWVLCPAAALVTMHLDQVLYPLLAALALLCALQALSRSPVYAMAAGLTVSLALYVSFSLIFLIPAILLIWGCLSVGRFRRKRHENGTSGEGELRKNQSHVTSGGSDRLTRPDRRRNFYSTVILFVLGLVAGWAFLRLTLGFNLPIAWRRSMIFHIQWRHTAGLVGPAGILRNFVEFAIWLGLPAALIYLRAWFRSAKKFIRPIGPILHHWDLFALLYPLLLLAVCVFGHTTAEIARLWLPLMIPLMLPIARELSALYRRRPQAYVLLATAMILLIKNFHDF